MSSKFPGAGVGMYALLAAGGDCGASVAPQLVGIITDKVSTWEISAKLGEMFAITSEQIGMRAGMLGAALFPIAVSVLIFIMLKFDIIGVDKRQ